VVGTGRRHRASELPDWAEFRYLGYLSSAFGHKKNNFGGWHRDWATFFLGLFMKFLRKIAVSNFPHLCSIVRSFKFILKVGVEGSIVNELYG
jgi:hypothetical protein